jgi:predicted ribosomally synthesized peptide with nif11-like leader
VPDPLSRQASSETTPEELHQLTAFSRHLTTHPQVADRVRSSGNPEEIVAVASETGFQISVEILRSKLWDLQADHWPWARQSGRSRIQFFRQT